MEIKASQRRTLTRSARPLHRTLARRYSWQQRLLYGGMLALALSVAAWILGLSLPLHLALIGLGLIAGSFWRSGTTKRRALRWAFSWIESRAGLGYLTAFELPEGDPHGLGEAVRARAAKASTLDTPPLQPWFLPLVVIALTLAVVPHLTLPALRAPFAPPTQADPQLPTNPDETVFGPEDAATTEDATPAETTPTPEAGTPAEPQTAAENPDAERSFDTATGGDEGLGEAQGEQAALNRFLEQTEAAEVSTMQAQQGPSGTPAPTQGVQQGSAQGNSEDGEAQGTPSQEEAAQSSAGGQNARPQPGGGTAPEREASEQNPSQEGQAGQEQGDPGQSDSDEEARTSTEGPETPQEEPSTNEAQRAQAATEETDRRNESLARTGEPTVQRSAASDENDPVTQDIKGGQSSERGGTRPGAEVESSRERLGGREGTPERISGIRRNGPSNFGGEALQQGGVPEALPRTGDAASYRRAAEETIREGRIPLEYQEIVRDYFR